MSGFKRPSFWLAILAMALIVYEIRLLILTEGYVGLQDIALLTQEVDAMKQNVNQSRSELDDLKAQLERVQSENSETEIARLLRQEAERYRMYSGMTDVLGEGLIIVIDDGQRALQEWENPNDLIVHDLDLRRLVDELRIAGAEAISVNGKRVVAGITEIICNGPTIRINGVQLAPPYVIRAIGDRYALDRRMKDPESYAHTLWQSGLQMEINTQVRLSVEKLNKLPEFKYAKESK